MEHTADIPSWWVENEELRGFLDLPSYEPPRFEDDSYTHSVVPDLEETYDCEILFVGVNTEYLENWEVRLDGEFAFPIGRRRDENGNTIYEMGGEEFCRRVKAVFDERHR